MLPDNIIAVDYETYYDDEYSLKTMLPWAYTRDPRFKCTLVSVYKHDFQWVGKPEDFDWKLLEGMILLHHNASFDGLVTTRMEELGIIPASPRTMLCTADMSVYLRGGRSLKDACKNHLGIILDKRVRDDMKGLTPEQAKERGLWDDFVAYALSDAVHTYKLAEAKLDQWPEAERELSRLNREAQWRPMLMATAKLDDGIAHVKGVVHDFLTSIPWKDTDKPLSVKAARQEARNVGINDFPGSLSKKDPAANAWIEKWAPQFPWVRAMRDYRSANGLLNKLDSLRRGIDKDNFYRYVMLYCGAVNTGRFSGGFEEDHDDAGESKQAGKFNMLNMPKKPMFDVDVRSLFIAPPGFKFVVSDYSQVEARYVLWRAGETNFLEMLNQEGNLYQAYAKMRGIYKGNSLKKDNFDLYQYSKVGVLGCGFGCGAAKFKDMAETDYGIFMDEATAKQEVTAYRETFPKVPQYWSKHQTWLTVSAEQKDATHVVPLRSGRVLTYFNPSYKVALDRYGKQKRDIVASTVMGAPPHKLYGGKLTENEVQASCRDIMRDGWLALDKRGYFMAFTVYDELVGLVPDDMVEQAVKKDFPECMCHSSPFAEGCPLDVEIHVTDHYMK